METIRRPRAASLRALAAASLLLPLGLTACGQSGTTTSASNLSEPTRAVMSQYETVRAALAADDLRSAKQAAAKLADSLKTPAANTPASPMLNPAQVIADAPALDKARQAFKKLSVEAIHLTSGVSGFYVVNCPMTPEGDWVQTNQTVDNPYMGKIMHDCGVVKK